MPSSPRDPRPAAADLREGITRLADVLYRLDTSPELSLVRDRSQLRGRSASRAAEAAELVDGLWVRYPLLSEAGERLEAALTNGDQAGVRSLLGGGGITLPDGKKVSAPALLKSLEKDAERASSTVAELAAAWRSVVPRLDALNARLQEATETAAALGMPTDPELAAARLVVEEVATTATADPLGADLDDAERLMARAQERLSDLARTRAGIGTDLDAAEAKLRELEQLITAGAGAREAATARIVDPGGLLPPLDPAVLDSGDRALRPWLKRLRAQADAGAWPAAAKALEQWQEEADAWHARASAVAATNRAPLERRNDLRGLLDAFRAKAAAMGLAEDETLTRLYRSAREALYAYRCDVRQAEARVREYGRAIELPPSGAGR